MNIKSVSATLLLTFVGAFISKAQDVEPNVVIQKELEINATIDKSWQVLGPEFATADKWAATVYKSEGKGKLIHGKVPSQRVCITPMGTLNETILEYSEDKHLLAYNFEGMPKMVRFAKNTWQLAKLPDGKTKLTLAMEMKIGGFMGSLMKPMLKSKMSKMAQHTIEEFQYYLETGEQHPRKVKSANKYNRKNS